MMHIIAAIGLSGSMHEVIETAASLTKAFDGRLRILVVISDQPAEWCQEYGFCEPYVLGFGCDSSFLLDESLAVGRDSFLSDEEEDIRTLETLHGLLSAQEIEAECVLLYGDTAEELLAEIERFKADWVVLSHHRNSFLDHFIFGNSAERLIAKVSCPVVIAPERSLTEAGHIRDEGKRPPSPELA